MVKDPADGRAGKDPDNTNNKHYVVFCASTLNNTVNCPNDVKHGKSEKYLYKERKLVKGFNKTHK
jgi:hypothetical protein